jgi:hypothetical protein
VAAKLEAGGSEHVVARAEPSHGLADGFNFASELHSQYFVSWREESVHGAYEEWVCFSEPPVGCANGCGVDTDQKLVILGSWLIDGFELEDVGAVRSGDRRPLSCLRAYHLFLAQECQRVGAEGALGGDPGGDQAQQQHGEDDAGEHQGVARGGVVDDISKYPGREKP